MNHFTSANIWLISSTLLFRMHQQLPVPSSRRAQTLDVKPNSSSIAAACWIHLSRTKGGLWLMELSNNRGRISPCWSSCAVSAQVHCVCARTTVGSNEKRWDLETGGEVFSSLVPEGQCLFNVLAICANNGCPHWFVLQRRRQKKHIDIHTSVQRRVAMCSMYWVFIKAIIH